MTNRPFIIVVGASAGGISPLCELMAQFEPDINAAVFVVLHLSNKGIGTFLKDKIQRYTSLPCKIAKNESAIEKGHIYLAPADFHLIVKENQMLITSGPPESRWRPSIDILFRSAAAAHREYVIGVELTGLLDDGAAGMIAIHKCGGTAIVQDPDEAEYPDMPLSVLQAMQVDHVARLAEMGKLINNIIGTKVIAGIKAPPEVMAEAGIAERTASRITDTMKLGTTSVYNCPDCGGSLWERKDEGITSYRCFIGHRYSEPELHRQQNQKLEQALWIAVRMMEEKRNLLNKLSEQDQARGLVKISSDYVTRANEFEEYIQVIKQVLYSLNDYLEP